MYKYNNTKTIIDGITFDSKAEANRFRELKLLEKANKITKLELQPKFLLQDKFKYNGKTYRQITYIADFVYIENGKTIVEDVKGFRTKEFNLKEKLFLKQFGDVLEFRIVK